MRPLKNGRLATSRQSIWLSQGPIIAFQYAPMLAVLGESDNNADNLLNSGKKFALFVSIF